METKKTASTDMTKPVKVAIVIPTNVYFLSGVRNFILDTAHNVAGFDNQWAHRFQSVADELTNNAIEHGSAAGNEIELAFTIEHQKSITLVVSDHGTGPIHHSASELTKLAAAAAARANEPSFDLRGRGFQIISNWSDSLDFIDNTKGGISVTVTKNYTPAAESTKQSITTSCCIDPRPFALNN